MSLIDLAQKGDLSALQRIQKKYKVPQSLWQKVAEKAAESGHRDILLWLDKITNLDYIRIAFAARSGDQEEIAANADGFGVVVEADAGNEYDDFPIHLSGPEGDPTEEKGKWVFDWIAQDYSEEFLPEEPNVIDTEGTDYEEEEGAYSPFTGENPGWGFRGDHPRKRDAVYHSDFDDDEDEDLIDDRSTYDIPLSE